ncbi:hypothetical protein HBI25_001550 [Parastagonospora nodorum]|nr:hypothetical protein HBH52_033600 [Parastagonospora nodorum]KAH4001078.1 hypothetical protein HBI10_093590 [Parastagonospora nodorum]KAH4060460.1 hypothetical protein HBH49_002320 [Parastagonospora nodorum]KAH4073111.1 hypothetical protein HBH50_049700 [Parastagonospora nodorum]KAH4109170.1 hypothetical protein HBH46_035140 [Parastagonospora nodorum]
MASSHYHYDDLSSETAAFRLFRIQKSQPCPTGTFSKVEICLFEATFDGHPEYEAVSYAWGRDPASSTIMCNDKNLDVTPNVEAILHMLSSQANSTGAYWIDSICINQSSVSEKNTQVPRMSSIYSKARLVRIWLGEASHEVETALGFLKKVATNSASIRSFSESESLLSEWYERFKDEVRDTRQYYDAVDTNFIIDLLNLPWFHRVWPIQELVLSQSAVLIFGSIYLPWFSFVHALSTVQVYEHLHDRSRSNPASYYDDTECYRATASLVRTPNGKISLSEIFRVTRPKLSTVPEDKVYGLYGMFDYMQIQGLPRVSYGRAVHTIYTEVTGAVIESERSLDILYQVCLPNLVNYLPSWVPDYSNTSYFRPILIGDSCASGTSQPWFSFNGLHLSVRAIVVDEVDEVAQSTSIAMPSFRRGYKARQDTIESEHRRTGVLNLVRTLQAWVRLRRKSRDLMTNILAREAFHSIIVQNTELHKILPYYTPVLLDNALEDWMYIITANFSDDPTVLRNLLGTIRDTPEYHATLQDYAHLFGYGTDPELWPDELKIRFVLRLYKPELAMLQHEIFLNSYHKTFITTRDGCMGTCPRWANPGDMIALIQGLKVPFIVRKAGEHYSLIGPAYIEGMMYGKRWNVDASTIITLV